MREIRFRAYIKNLKWIVPVERINFDIDTVEVDLTCGNGDTAEYEFGEIVLMQYIGIKDKYGKEIYEGDVIQTYFSFAPGDAGYGVSQKPFTVKWERGRSGFRAYKPNAKDWHLLDTIDFFEMQAELYEVIGNIHDNPELLK